jgi:hypothetical protein
MSNLQSNVKSVIFQIYCIGVNQKISDESKINKIYNCILKNNNDSIKRKNSELKKDSDPIIIALI